MTEKEIKMTYELNDEPTKQSCRFTVTLPENFTEVAPLEYVAAGFEKFRIIRINDTVRNAFKRHIETEKANRLKAKVSGTEYEVKPFTDEMAQKIADEKDSETKDWQYTFRQKGQGQDPVDKIKALVAKLTPEQRKELGL